MKAAFDLLETPLGDGTTLIEASAGTGKTYCLSMLVLRMLLEGHAGGIGRVLAVTFGRSATQELIARIRGALTEAVRIADGETDGSPDLAALVGRYDSAEHQRLREALATIDELSVFTIHGFCARVLRDSALESGTSFDFEVIAEPGELLRQAASDCWRATFYPDSLLATVAALNKWTPDALLSDTAELRRYPEATIEPPRIGRDAARQALAAAIDAAIAGFDRGRLDAVLPAHVLKKSHRAKRDERLQAIEHKHPAENVDSLRALLKCTRENVRNRCLKRHGAVADSDPFFAACDAVADALSALRREIYCCFAADLESRARRLREDADLLSYDDLLGCLRDALRDPRRGRLLAESVRERFDVALIDEFQDTDLCQWEILRRLFADRRLFLIGDPKQSIYGFRGADVFAYFDAVEQADHRYTLGTNWRSTPEMVTAVNAVFSSSDDPFVYDEIEFSQVEAARKTERASQPSPNGAAALHWLWLDRRTDKNKAAFEIVEAVGVRISRLIGSRPAGWQRTVGAGDIAVLVRTNNQARLMQAALQREGVATVVSTTGSVLALPEARELQQLLMAVADPANPGLIRGALATRLCGYDSRAIEALDRDPERAQREAGRFISYLDRWRRENFMSAMESLFADFATRARLLRTVEGERALTNLSHLLELLNESGYYDRFAPQTALSWFAHRRAEAEAAQGASPESEALRRDSDAAAVQILTVHRSKGLEYEIVFCPFLIEPLRAPNGCPLIVHRRPTEIVADFGSASRAEHLAALEAESLAEEARLAYVALTRARRECYVVAGVIGSRSSRSILSYLLRPAGKGTATKSPQERVASWCDWAESDLKDDDRLLHQALESLADARGSFMTLEPLRLELAAPSRSEEPSAKASLEARRFPADARERLRPWQVSSFSSLQRGIENEEPDYADPPAGLVDERPAGGTFSLARGARMGRCLHEILESLDFDAVSSERAAELIRRTLECYALDQASAHYGRLDPVAVVSKMLSQLVETTLPQQNFCLRDVEKSRWLSEWRFHASVGDISSDELGRAFQRWSRDRIREVYAPRLERLGRRRLQGFLTGFVDALFEHEGRWYLIDWKSNYLGSRASDYDDDAVWSAMCRHDYVLQYHLYVLALHRYLGARMPDYDYRKNFGGVYYVFLRAPDQPSAWYRDLPPRELIEGLDGAVGGVS